MASFLYDYYKHVRAAPGTLGTSSTDACDLETDNLAWALLLNTHTPNAATHDFYDDIAADVVGTDQSVTGQSVGTDGTFDAANPTWSSLSGSQVGYVLLYKETGGATSTKMLIALLDSADVTGLPFTPSGTDVTLQVDVTGLFE